MDRSSIVSFGLFTLDQARMVLQREARPVPIGSRAAAFLDAPVNTQGQVVTESELLDTLWPNQEVEEHNLTIQIAALRQAMGGLPDGTDAIRTGSWVSCRPARGVVA